MVCKIQRHSRGWTQETLAELSGLQVRTIQRVENAEPSSPETRRALARAFDAEDIDVFNKVATFSTMEEIEAKAKAEKEAFDRDYIKLAVVPATGRLLIRELNGCGGFAAEIVDDDLLQSREAREAWGAFVDNARDFGDIADEIGETGRLDAADQVDEQIKALQRLGISLYVGIRKLVSGTGEKERRFRVVQVVGAPKGKPITEVAAPKKVQMGL
jgi:transcriptional regulator with XRE-family HTH domain